MISTFVLAPLISNAEDAAFKTERGNIYSAGVSIGITENASNDIVAAAGNLVITGNAGNEVLAAGGSVAFSGKTGGDARMAGGRVTISGTIGGEAVIAGGKIVVLPEAMIGSDLIAAAGNITIEGTIGRSARIIADSVFINGTINNNVEIEARELAIGKRAVIKGNLRYEAQQEARTEQGAVIKGQKIFTQKEFQPPRSTFLKFLWIAWLVKLAAVIAAALVIYFALREKTMEVTALALNRFGSELLTGFIVFVVIPAVILLLFMTAIGFLLGLVILFFYIAFIMLSGVIGALVFTRFASGYVFKKEASFAWPVILLGVLIYQAIGLIPIFGWIFKFVFFLSALGALSHLFYLRSKEKRSPAGQ